MISGATHRVISSNVVQILIKSPKYRKTMEEMIKMVP
jgi:hypothetical protein